MQNANGRGAFPFQFISYFRAALQVLDNIKTTIGSIFLRRNMSRSDERHNRLPFDQMQEIGIVYNAGDKTDEAAVQTFANELRDQGKKVFLLGYVHLKHLPHSKKIHITSEFFWKEKLSFFNLPDPARIGRFLDIRFDVLMNLYFDELLPLKGVAALSKARYRVGANVKDAVRLYDCVLDTGSNHDVYNLAKQMEHYLKVMR